MVFDTAIRERAEAYVAAMEIVKANPIAALVTLRAGRPSFDNPEGTQPFAYFQYNDGWGLWEQVADEYRNEHDGILAAYTHPR